MSKKMLEREEAKEKDLEVYQRGYFDGYHKAYSDVRSKVNAAKKKEREVYRKKLESIEAANVYPLNMIYSLTEEYNFEEPIRISPETVNQAMASVLSERELLCVEMYYRDQMSLDEIAEKYSITRERVRQIILKAGRKLVSPSSMNKIRVVSLEEYQALQRKYEIASGQIDVMDMPIEELDLSIRSYNCLKRRGIYTIGAAYDLSDDDYRRIRNLGEKSIKEIKTKLLEYISREDNNE